MEVGPLHSREILPKPPRYSRNSINAAPLLVVVTRAQKFVNVVAIVIVQVASVSIKKFDHFDEANSTYLRTPASILENFE